MHGGKPSFITSPDKLRIVSYVFSQVLLRFSYEKQVIPIPSARWRTQNEYLSFQVCVLPSQSNSVHHYLALILCLIDLMASLFQIVGTLPIPLASPHTS